MRDLALDSPLVLCVLVVVFSAFSSLMPLSPAEPVLVGVAAVSPTWLLLPLLVLATLSHMSTKTLVFMGGRKAEHCIPKRCRDRFERARARLAGRADLQRSTLFVSSVTGLPPFYLTTALCGTLRMPLRHFLMLATTGRGIRFAALIFLPQLFRPQTLGAQQPDALVARPAAISVTGSGAETFVLVSGMVGGVAGFDRLQERLLANGYRVVVVDPYLLSIDSAHVSFDDLARRVDVALSSRGIESARVIGHAHGGGVALRLAARPASKVSELILLDVGALESQRGRVFSASMRLVPLITRLPYGREFVRSRFLAGIRDNSGSTSWLDSATQRRYTEPVLDDIDRVIAMASRLAAAQEPEPVAAVIARIEAPVTVIRGALKRPASASESEMTRLAVLGSRFRIRTLPGVAHFPHEEAPDLVVTEILRTRHTVAARIGAAR